MNNTWEIEVSSPLLRPGITIRTNVSEKYLVPALKKAMDAVREFNEPGTPKDPKSGQQGYVWRGKWDKDTEYQPFDAVAHNGCSYYATKANKDSEPQWNSSVPGWKPLTTCGGGGGI